MKVLYAYDFRSELLEKELGARKVELDELLVETDCVSIHAPLMKSTRHLMSTDQFRTMKKDACFFTTSRGPVIDEKDLVEALRFREIAGAGLDVYENEPKMAPGPADPEKVVISPRTVSSRSGIALKAAINQIVAAEGAVPPDCLNSEVFK